MPGESRVAIFTLTKNRLAYTKRMMSSLIENTHYPFDHFIVDNGSADGTLRYLDQNRANFAKIILNEDNKGISIGWNQALEAIGRSYDYIIKLDNDCEIMTKDWLRPLLEICRAFDNRIVLSPFVDGLHQHKGGVPRYGFRQTNGYSVGLTKHLGGISLIAPAHIYEDFRFNETLPLRGNQDRTFSDYLGNRGYLLGYVEDIKVLHMDTTVGQQERYPEYFSEAESERWTVYGRTKLFMKQRIRLGRKVRQLKQRWR